MEKLDFNRVAFNGRELDYIAESVQSGHIAGNGPFTKRAEALLADIHGGSRSLLTTSCTHSLEMSAMLLDLQPGDEVIVPAFAFVSTANAFVVHGATPVFVDVRGDTMNLDVEAVEAALGPKTRAICAIHYGGVAAEPDRLANLASSHDVMLIEDNADGLGGQFNGQALGTFGALSAASFHETKNVTCGEGGALIVNDARLSDRAEVLREKGTNRSRFFRGEVDKYTWTDIGSSYVMSDLLAAVLTAQLERIGPIQSHRLDLWQRYESELADWAAAAEIDTPAVPEGCEHTGHVYFLQMHSSEQRDQFIAHMRGHGVQAVFHYQPLHSSTVGRRFGGQVGQFPVAERAADTLVRLPIHAALTPAQQGRVIAAVQSFAG